MSTYTASGKLLESLLQLASHYDPGKADGHDSPLQQELLTDAGLTRQDLGKPDARFPADNFCQVLHRLARVSKNPQIALRLAEATQPRMLGSVGFLLSTAQTLGDALQALENYLPILIESLHLELTHRYQGSDQLRIRLTAAHQPEQQNVTEFFLACLLNWPRWLTGRQIPVTRVAFAAQAPDNPARYRQLFAADVVFSADDNSILMPESYLSLPCVDANREVHQLHREFADTLLSKTNQKSALTAQVRALIRQQLQNQGEAIRREHVARQLGMSLRTLQRKLGDVGSNFQQLYDQTRQELCLQFIHRAEMSFGEIAFQLGFSNQSAFQKAFKRWLGIAPSQYRRSLKQPPATAEPLAAAAAKADTAAPTDQTCPAVPDLTRTQAKLNAFGRRLLQFAALIGEHFPLPLLAAATGEPIARLMIHLWPAEQDGLIQRLPDQQEALEFCFSTPAEGRSPRQQLLDQLKEPEQQHLHQQLGLSLMQQLPPAPGDCDSYPRLKQTLKHLNLGYPGVRSFSDLPPEQPLTPRRLGQLNLQAALSALSEKARLLSLATPATPAISATISGSAGESLWQTRQQEALDYAATAARWLKGTPDLRLQSLLLQALLQLQQQALAPAEQALQQAEALLKTSPQQATHNTGALQPVYTFVYARFMAQNDQPQAALQYLLKLCPQPLPEQENNQLTELLNQLEPLKQQLTTTEAAADVSTEQTPQALPVLILLQQISEHALQLNQPLLAACTLGRMAGLCLQPPFRLNGFSHYALSGLAWVAAWFYGDQALARRLLTQIQSGPVAPLFSRVTDLHQALAQQQERLSLAQSHLNLSRQLLHAFDPLSEVRRQLQALYNTPALPPPLQAQERLLHYQLSTLQGEASLTRLLQQGSNDYERLQLSQPAAAGWLNRSSLYLIRCLQGQSVPLKAVYRHPDQAASHIRTLLLLNRQKQWPELFDWQARLENERPGYYIVSDSLFCLGLMRLILSQQEQRLSLRRSRIIDQTETRLMLWAEQSPGNFSGQLLLLQAEKARLAHQLNQAETPADQPQPGPCFEQAIAHFKAQGFQGYQALAYERYASWLAHCGQPLLAGICRQKACSLYRHWGATAKAAQLEQSTPAGSSLR